MPYNADNLTKLRNSIFLVSEEHETPIDSEGVRKALNTIFDKSRCLSVLYTTNTDKIFFGVVVNPVITPEDVKSVLTGSEIKGITDYSLEIDSKVFDIGLTPDELVSYILYEVSSMIKRCTTLNEIKNEINLYQMNFDTTIHYSDASKYNQLFILAFKDALIKLSSLLYSDSEEISQNSYIASKEELHDHIVSVLVKIKGSAYGLGHAVRHPKLRLLEWVINVYKNMSTMYNTAIELLKEAKALCGSKLIAENIERAIYSLECPNEKYGRAEPFNESSDKDDGLFMKIKRSGLRGLENDLYEFNIRVQAAEDEAEAFYCLNQINRRLNLIDDYIYHNEKDLSDREIKRWDDIAQQYRDLRIALSKKKIVNKKQYGLFFDYQQLDGLR